MVTAGILYITMIPIGIRDPSSINPNTENYYQMIWYVVFSSPIIFSVLQMGLIFVFFNYDSPNILKQNNEDLKLRELLAKIYTSSVI